MNRHNSRPENRMREICIEKNFTKHAEGSVLISFGDTKVLCTASIVNSVPPFLRNSNQGWLTAEYGMLPRSTHTRMNRESARGKQTGRTQEIQRLIGRSLRAAVDLEQFPGYTIAVDCDVIQADGGTRTAAISGASIAIEDAIAKMKEKNIIAQDINPIKTSIAAISVGMYQNKAILDLDYNEDSNAETDMNVVMNSEGGIIEIQGTAEKDYFTHDQLNEMLGLAKIGITNIFSKTR